MSDLTCERFKRVFQMNVERRSRTAKGKDEGSKTSSKKLPLLLQGEALKAKVAENVARLMDDVWYDAVALRQHPEVRLGEASIRVRCERWYDLACEGLIDEAGYAPVFTDLESKVSALIGTPIVINRRYRTWTPGYLVLQISPPLIDGKLEEMLYLPLGVWLNVIAPRTAPIENAKLAAALAHADMMMDGEVHPWIDGCSRVSTALCMWLAALYGGALPLFAPTKDEHYAPLRQGIAAHERYFEACLARAESEVP
jgi:hypothetical protein